VLGARVATAIVLLVLASRLNAQEPEPPIMPGDWVRATSVSIVSAQEPPSKAMESEGQDRVGGLHLRISALAALTANPSRLHGAGGVSAGVEWHGWGLVGLAMLGRGGEYESRLLAGAASRRIISVSRISLEALGGYGYYFEQARQGANRSSGGILFGGSAGVQFGKLSVMVLVTDLTGTYDGLDVASPFRFHVLRYSIAVGVIAGG
jgi:hypothetical protein